MLFWISQQIIISLVLIALIHSIYVFLQNNLTTPKIRDLVKRPIEQYDEIYQTIKKPQPKAKNTPTMKNELQNYLKELSNSIQTGEPTGHDLTGQDNKFSDNFQTL